jgi:hypothetical protein|tara:strand:+ start:35086 stop:36204 length:1119 start_codon:yes stop_codon:yes gene_type:complete
LAWVELTRGAAERFHEKPSVHAALAEALESAGLQAEARSVLAAACGRFPGHEALHGLLARTLFRAGELEGALAVARAWSDRDWATLLSFTILIRQGRVAEAATFEDAVASLDPAHVDLLDARAMRARGKPGDLLEMANATLSIAPGASHALYYKAVALAQMGRGDEATAIMGIDRFLQSTVLPVPAGFADTDAFHRALTAEIKANPDLHTDPVGHASRGGLRTRVFPASDDVAAPALVEAIRNAVSGYAGDLSGDHPFVATRPASATFTPWALMFRGDGYQRLHHHPGRWLTGVYYVSVPDTSADAEALPGGIVLGGLPEWAGVAPPWPTVRITPKPGMLLLFPSFVPHETLPTGCEFDRISVAFDIADRPH